eukprot:1087028-Pyramimonas_sp.AAC.1
MAQGRPPSGLHPYIKDKLRERSLERHGMDTSSWTVSATDRGRESHSNMPERSRSKRASERSPDRRRASSPSPLARRSDDSRRRKRSPTPEWTQGSQLCLPRFAFKVNADTHSPTTIPHPGPLTDETVFIPLTAHAGEFTHQMNKSLTPRYEFPSFCELADAQG